MGDPPSPFCVPWRPSCLQPRLGGCYSGNGPLHGRVTQSLTCNADPPAFLLRFLEPWPMISALRSHTTQHYLSLSLGSSLLFFQRRSRCIVRMDVSGTKTK